MEQLSFSKINIGLAIVGKRPDGYHDIDTIFQSIHLGDSIYFAKHHSVVFSGMMPELPPSMQEQVTYDESNLALRALRAVQAYTGCKAGGAIHLLKRVPPGAGIGGGSGDAAAMIKGLNRFWRLGLTEADMMAIARPLGADVPFLLRGGTARGRGIGDELTPLPEVPTQWLLVVNPHVHASTADAYRRFEGHSEANEATMDAVQGALEAGDVPEAFRRAKNTFEELLFPVHPAMAACKQFFVDRGLPVIMSGSGSSMVVALEAARDALSLQQEIQAAGHNWLSLITKTKMQEEEV